MMFPVLFHGAHRLIMGIHLIKVTCRTTTGQQRPHPKWGSHVACSIPGMSRLHSRLVELRCLAPADPTQGSRQYPNRHPLAGLTLRSEAALVEGMAAASMAVEECRRCTIMDSRRCSIPCRRGRVWDHRRFLQQVEEEIVWRILRLGVCHLGALQQARPCHHLSNQFSASSPTTSTQLVIRLLAYRMLRTWDSLTRSQPTRKLMLSSLFSAST
mmetsp:Transcript_101225/g.290449  ORF Transcript_101225/g.290449 Transcript_101225/m.290449 type:complete len:213 (+) Transcript_101225:577-1215(+)